MHISHHKGIPTCRALKRLEGRILHDWVTHQKNHLTYHLYAAVIFLAHALSCLEIYTASNTLGRNE